MIRLNHLFRDKPPTAALPINNFYIPNHLQSSAPIISRMNPLLGRVSRRPILCRSTLMVSLPGFDRIEYFVNHHH